MCLTYNYCRYIFLRCKPYCSLAKEAPTYQENVIGINELLMRLGLSVEPVLGGPERMIQVISPL